MGDLLIIIALLQLIDGIGAPNPFIQSFHVFHPIEIPAYLSGRRKNVMFFPFSLAERNESAIRTSITNLYTAKTVINIAKLALNVNTIPLIFSKSGRKIF
ncbi:hypothetical protein [Leclercia tamurae]|uniref:Uncharacterized protein n=1 Tax=Leclercia tamurae TaxID=2926467 RepID=A0ABT2R7S5_9ENTR|nr:hypothetical protein [Leclercia tamurae]MCU6676924.1 hypothetical protein [Leclercia tamurae]